MGEQGDIASPAPFNEKPGDVLGRNVGQRVERKILDAPLPRRRRDEEVADQGAAMARQGPYRWRGGAARIDDELMTPVGQGPLRLGLDRLSQARGCFARDASGPGQRQIVAHQTTRIGA